MTDNLRERIARAVHEDLSRQDVMAHLDGNFDAGRTADAVLAEMRKDAGPVAWSYTHGDVAEKHGEATILYHMQAAFLKGHGWTETPLYAHPPVDDREITTSGVDDRGEGVDEKHVAKLRRALEPFARLSGRKANYVIRPNDPAVLEAVRALES